MHSSTILAVIPSMFAIFAAASPLGSTSKVPTSFQGVLFRNGTSESVPGNPLPKRDGCDTSSAIFSRADAVELQSYLQNTNPNEYVPLNANSWVSWTYGSAT